MKTTKRIVTGTILLAFLHIASAAEFFVATNGKDSQPGTKAKPFATLERGHLAARKARREKPDQPVTVWLAAGIYHRINSLWLTADDGGVTFAAKPGERAVLTGGRELERKWFEPCKASHILDRIGDESARSKVWQVNLRAHGISDYGENRRRGFAHNNFQGTPPLQLYIGGQRMILARWPNPDEKFPQYLHPFVKERPGVVGRAGKGAVLNPGPTARDAGFRLRGGTFRYAFDRAGRWLRAEDIWLDGIFNLSWEWSYNRVAKIDATAKTITLAYGECNGIADQYSGDFFFAENLLEELDRPGEYWLDRKTGTLYLIPPSSFFKDGVAITVTMLGKPMIVVNSTSHIVFRNLELEFGRNFAAQVRKSDAIRFEHCVVRDFTGRGLDLDGKNHSVVACQLLRNGGTSVSLSGGDLLTLERGGSVVEDCEILDSGWYHRVYHPAIALRGVGHRASHNRIRGHPHQAIAVSGNDQLIEGNDIGRVCEEFSDMAAVYIYSGEHPTQRGQIVRGNFIHDLGRWPMQHGVYPDNGTMGVLIEGNVFARIGGAPPARVGQAGNTSSVVNNNSGAYIATRNNFFIDCPVPYVLSAHSGGKNHDEQKKKWQAFFARHLLTSLPHVTKYPELKKFWDEERRFPTSNTYERNSVWNPTRPLIASWVRGRKQLPAKAADGVVEEYAGLSKCDNWVTDKDPGFVNAAGGDYTLAPEAEVFRTIPGFKPIPFREIGPRVKPGLE
ncbi:MAG: right-handed parallel beta-helix repeat-containing protein [Verrucomicrobia bacterium]|nr:right-handed parallel beta-helix repeat-containing protein [Verrucomicrobiota bacterium]